MGKDFKSYTRGLPARMKEPQKTCGCKPQGAWGLRRKCKPSARIEMHCYMPGNTRKRSQKLSISEEFTKASIYEKKESALICTRPIDHKACLGQQSEVRTFFFAFVSLPAFSSHEGLKTRVHELERLDSRQGGREVYDLTFPYRLQFGEEKNFNSKSSLI